MGDHHAVVVAANALEQPDAERAGDAAEDRDSGEILRRERPADRASE